MSNNDSRNPNRVDVHVGRRVRERRHALGVSQEKLAEALGLTFQQVQKYERAANRISASKLFEIARFLETPVEFFFEGLAVDEPARPATPLERARADALLSPEGVRLVDSLAELSAAGRRAVANVAATLAELELEQGAKRAAAA